MNVSEDLRDILVCPLTRMPLRLIGDEFISDAAGLAYPIEDGTPIFIVEYARKLERV